MKKREKSKIKKREMVWMAYQTVLFFVPATIAYLVISDNTSLAIGAFLLLFTAPMQFHAGMWGEKPKAFIDNYFFR